MKYQRLTPGQRYQLELLKRKQIGVREISRQLNVSPSTISRELRRGAGLYCARRAQAHADRANGLRARARRKIQGKTVRLVERGLFLDLSPEQLSAVLRDEHSVCVSLWTIYRYVERDKLEGGRLKSRLRILRKQRKDRKRPKYRKCLGLVRDRVSITERPEIINERLRIGDYERDTVLGKRGGPLLLSIVERKTGYVHLECVRTLNARSVHKATVRALRHRKVHSITNDNGVEFAFHKQTAKTLNTRIYFARSYAAWERGTNENLNGLLRQYHPRKQPIPMLSRKEIRRLELKLNTRPRKRLGFKTPYELYHGKPYGRVLR